MKKDAISPAVPYLIIPVGIMAVSTASLFIRFAQDYASSLTIAAFRLGLAALILLPYTIYKHGPELKSLKPADLKYALLAGLILAVHFASWITSLEFTSVASSVVLVTSTPLWVAMLAPIFLKERTPKIAFLGMGIALVGGVIIAGTDICQWESGRLQCQFAPGSSAMETLLGDLLAVIGAIAGAFYLMIGRHLRSKISLTPYVFLVYSAAALLLLIGMLVVDGIPPRFPSQVYLWLGLLAILPQLIGHSIFNWSLKYLPTGYVAVNLLGEPVGSILLAYFFLGEVPPAVKIIGAILILAGILLASLQANSNERDPQLKEHLQ